MRAGRLAKFGRNQIVGRFQGPGKTGHEYPVQFASTVAVEYISIQVTGRKQILQINGIKVDEVNATGEFSKKNVDNFGNLNDVLSFMKDFCFDSGVSIDILYYMIYII